MQKDLENLAKEMKKKISMGNDRKRYLFNMEHCRELSCHQRNKYAEEEHYQEFKRILVLDLARKLIGNWSALRQLSESPQEDIALYIKVRKGIDSFVLASPDERYKFHKTVLGKFGTRRVISREAAKLAGIAQNRVAERV